jgi:hypothetical protein
MRERTDRVEPSWTTGPADALAALKAIAQEYEQSLPGNSEIRPLRERRLAALRFAIETLAGPADAGSHETLRALIAKWRDEADGVTAMGYSQQADRMRDCADELEAALAASASAPAAPRETKTTE